MDDDLDDGAVHVTLRLASWADTFGLAGAVGVPAVAVTGADHGPTPTEFTAATRKSYVTPLNKRLTVRERDFDTDSGYGCQSDPPMRYCTR